MSTLKLLSDFGLRHTEIREKIVSVFISHTEALAQHDLEQNLPDKTDRITVYRTIKTFLEKGLLHKVLDDKGVPRYALCNEKCSSGDHNHDHVHFKCNSCNKTTCIDNIHVPGFKLPAGYKAQEINVLVLGICPQCKTP